MAKLVSWLLLGTLAFIVSCSKTDERGLAVTTEAVASPTPLPSPRSDPSPAPFELPAETESEKWPANFVVDETRLSVEGFTIEKRVRKERGDFYEQRNDPRNWVDTEYVVVKKGKRVVAKFDSVLAHPLGVTASFGLFPFLGRRSQQVFISQDTFRGGCQWVFSVSPRFRVIFDGDALGVGRESDDFQAMDLDEDGVYEIIAPITDFYQLQDKLYIGAIPLPDIILKYDLAKQQYLPANPIFKNRVFGRLAQVPEIDKESFNFQHRAIALSNLLIQIYAGEEDQGWKTYERDYKLDDKVELKQRVRMILKHQPVYKIIYHR